MAIRRFEQDLEGELATVLVSVLHTCGAAFTEEWIQSESEPTDERQRQSRLTKLPRGRHSMHNLKIMSTVLE